MSEYVTAFGSFQRRKVRTLPMGDTRGVIMPCQIARCTLATGLAGLYHGSRSEFILSQYEIIAAEKDNEYTHLPP